MFFQFANICFLLSEILICFPTYRLPCLHAYLHSVVPELYTALSCFLFLSYFLLLCLQAEDMLKHDICLSNMCY